MKRSIAILAVGAVAAAAHANYIVNGTFASPSVPAVGFYYSIPGWYAAYNSDSGAVEPIELGFHTDYGVYGFIGADNQNLEINSDAASTVVQNVAGLTAGDHYNLMFQYAQRNGDFYGMDNFAVVWDGMQVAQIDPSSNNASWAWLDVTANGSDQLQFVGDTPYNSSLGGEVDNVSLTTPGPEAFAPFAIGLIGFLRRRKRA